MNRALPPRYRVLDPLLGEVFVGIRKLSTWQAAEDHANATGRRVRVVDSFRKRAAIATFIPRKEGASGIRFDGGAM